MAHNNQHSFDEEGRARTAQDGVRPGVQVISDHVKTLPDAPGVYRMLDAKGEVCLLYTSPSPRD